MRFIRLLDHEEVPGMNLWDALYWIKNNKGYGMHNRDWVSDYYVFMNDEGKLVDSKGEEYVPGYMDTEGIYHLVIVGPEALQSGRDHYEF